MKHLAIGLLIAGLVAGGCSRQGEPKGEGSVQVVATIFPVADWAARVGGKHVAAQTLLPAGSSAHTFEPSPREMRATHNARLFLRVGLHLDDWAARLAGGAPASVRVLSLGEGLLERKQLPDVEDTLTTQPAGEGADHAHEHEHEGRNPHFWLDPVLAGLCVEQIGEALIQIDPAHAADYRANAQSYQAELRVLDEQLSRTLSSGCKQRAFVSFHNAYAYLAARYGLKVAAVIEEYPGKSPSERYLRGVVDLLRQTGIKTVFAEPQLSPRAAQIIASEVGATVDLLDPYGAADYPERDSYVKLMRYNGERLAKALGCDLTQRPVDAKASPAGLAYDPTNGTPDRSGVYRVTR